MNCTKCNEEVLVRAEQGIYHCMFCGHRQVMDNEALINYRREHDYEIKLRNRMEDGDYFQDEKFAFLDGAAFVEEYIDTMLDIIDTCEESIEGDYLQYLKNMSKRIRI